MINFIIISILLNLANSQLLTDTAGAYSVPLAYGNISQCVNSVCTIKSVGQAAMSLADKSRSSFNLPSVKLFNSSIVSNSYTNLVVISNKCIYSIDTWIMPLAPETDLTTYDTDMSCGTISKGVYNCNSLKVPNLGAYICFNATGVQTDCTVEGTVIPQAHDTRNFAVAATFKTEPKYQNFVAPKSVREISIAATHVDTSTNTSVTELVEWDGRSQKSVTVNGMKFNLLSTTNMECPDFSQYILVIDLSMPYDMYLVPVGSVNSPGESDPNKLHFMMYSKDGTLMWDPVMVAQKATRVRVISFKNARASVEIISLDQTEYFQNKRIARDSLRYLYNNVVFYDTSKFSQNDKWTQAPQVWSHVEVAPYNYNEYTKSGQSFNKLSTVPFIDETGTERNMGLYKDTLGVNRCYIDTNSGMTQTNGITAYMVLCNGTTMLFTCYSQNMDVNAGFLVNITNVPVKDKYGNCFNLNMLTMANDRTTATATYHLSLAPEQTAQMSFSFEVTSTVTWASQPCCPTITLMYDNPDTHNVEVTAYSSCGDGTAILTETGEVSNNPLSVSLTSVPTKFFYRRYYNSSGTQPLQLCCANPDKPVCVTKNLKLSNFPYIPPTDSDYHPPVNNSDNGHGGDDDTIVTHWDKFSDTWKHPFSSIFNGFMFVLQIIALLIILYIIIRIVLCCCHRRTTNIKIKQGGKNIADNIERESFTPLVDNYNRMTPEEKSRVSNSNSAFSNFLRKRQ